MTRPHSEIVFSITDLKIGSYNIQTDVLGTAIDMAEAQSLEFSFSADQDTIKAEGYDQHKLSVVTGGTFTLSSAGIDFVALATISGAYNTSSGSPQERSLQWDAGGAGLPYFWAAGKMVGEQSDDIHVGFAVCKLDMPPSWKFEQNKYVISECSGTIIKRSGGRLVYTIGHATAAAIDSAELFRVLGS